MKRKISLKHFFALFLLSATTLFAKGQVIWDTLPYKAFSDYKLQNLNKSIITSGILYDRVFPVADIERFKQQDQFTDTTGPRHWLQAYYELYNASYNNSAWLSPDALEARLDTNALVNAIPIGVLNYKYNVLDTNAYVDDLVDTLSNGQFVDVTGRPRSPYFNRSTFIASPIISDGAVFVEGQKYTFYLDPKFFVQNDNIYIQQIRVDFGDGNAEWVVNDPFGNGTMQRNFSITHFIDKLLGRTLYGRITVIGVDVLGHIIRYGNPFKILAKKKKDEYPLTACKGGKGGGVKWVIDPDPTKLASVNAQYGNPPALHNQITRTGPGLFDFVIEPVKDTAYFFFKNDGNNCTNKVVRRPVIFIDGFDPSNDRKVGDIYKDFINVQVDRNINGVSQRVRFGDYMLDNGNTNPNDDLDFIIFDFKHGNDLLERNAMALVALIERLNLTYGANYLQDITLIGPSMGSLIAQYALSYMEHNNIQHRVRTYISFDGCHQGANVPIGLQNYVEYITKRGILRGIKPIREGLYNGLGAKQLLAHHHSANSPFPAPDALRTQFLQNLAAVGEYPQLSRKVALINGAINGTLNPNHGTNTTILDIEIKRKGWKSIWGLCNDNICKKIKWTGRTATNSGTNKVTEMWTASPLHNVLFWVPLGKTNYYANAAWGNSSQDNAPGGLIGNVFSDDLERHGTFLAKELIYLLTGDKPTFNINLNNFTMMSSYSAADIRYTNKNLYSRIDQCPPTPFDHIYAPTENEEHVYVSEQGSVWFEDEARGTFPCSTICNGTISGAESFCTTEIYSAPLVNGATYTWSVDKPWLVTTNANGNTYQITRNGNTAGSLTITVQIIRACGTSALTRDVTMGYTMIYYNINPYSTGDECYTANALYYFQIEPGPNDHLFVSAHEWGYRAYNSTTETIVGDPNILNTTATIVFPTTGLYEVFVRPKNECGAGVESSTFVEVVPMCGGGGWFRISASPNPASDDLYVTIDDEKKEVKNLSEDEDVNMALHDFYTKQIVRQWKFKNKQSQHKLSVTGLKRGMYILFVSKGKYQQLKQIVVE